MEAVNYDWREPDLPHRIVMVGWPFLLLFGWVVFDLTADAALTALVICAKFGWNDWLTARWLRKTDPVHARAVACAWFYRASAIWKIALAATVGMFLLIFIEIAFLGRQAPGREWAFVACEAFFGFLFATLLTTIASISAWRSGQRVWLAREMHLMRRLRIWPPLGVMRRNGVPMLVVTALLTWLTPVGIFVLFAALAPIPRQPPPQAAFWMPIVLLGAIIGSAAFVLSLCEFVTKRVAAKSPQDCWPEIFGEGIV